MSRIRKTIRFKGLKPYRFVICCWSWRILVVSRYQLCRLETTCMFRSCSYIYRWKNEASIGLKGPTWIIHSWTSVSLYFCALQHLRSAHLWRQSSILWGWREVEQTPSQMVLSHRKGKRHDSPSCPDYRLKSAGASAFFSMTHGC